MGKITYNGKEITKPFTYDGKKVVKITMGSKILSLVTETFKNWITSSGMSAAVNQVMSSDDGSIMIAAAGHKVFKTLNQGKTWTEIKDVGGDAVAVIDMTPSGDRIFVASKTSGWGTTYVGSITVSSDQGDTWSPNYAAIGGGGIDSISVSDDGKYSVAVGHGSLGIMISKDYGNTYQSGFNEPYNTGLHNTHISGDGQHMLAVSGEFVYSSDNAGVTWGKTTAGGGAESIEQTAASDSCQHVLAIVGFAGAVSSDFGVTFDHVVLPTGSPIECVGVSGNGKYMIVGHHMMGMDFSEDYGKTWTSVSLPEGDMKKIEISEDGKYMAIGVGSGKIYISEDYGSNWRTPYDGHDGVYSMYMTQDGGYILAGTYSNRVHVGKK